MNNMVIGSGPAGRLASLELGKLNQDVTLIEKNHIAGTCLNEGCMVICALTDITKFINANNKFNSYGFIKSQIDISYEKIVEKIKQTQEKLRKLNEIENESVGNKIIYGKASISNDSIEVNGETLNYDNLLIATGARPFIPDIKGSEHGLTNKDILNIDKIPDKLNIIGGGIIACEVANIYATLGSEVNIIARSTFLKELDSDIRKYILDKVMTKVNVLEKTEVMECGKNKVITSNDELEGVAFFATGRIANSEIAHGIVDIHPDNTIKVDEMMKTNKSNIYAAGDVVGGWQLTPVARMEGQVAARNMAGYANKISYDCIAQSISLNLDVGFVNNKNESDETSTITAPGIAGPGVFWNILSGGTGLSKIEFSKKENTIKKITSISPSATSDVAYLSYLMRINSPLDEYSNFLEIHPSTIQIIKSSKICGCKITILLFLILIWRDFLWIVKVLVSNQPHCF